MKKKYPVTPKDKEDWANFAKKTEYVFDKDDSFLSPARNQQLRTLDLHGFSLDEANKKVKNFIIKSFEKNYEKLLIITGKGLRSKVHNNPYISESLNVLKNSIPNFIKDDEDLQRKISSLSPASLKDGGEGAFYIFLKKN